MIASIDTRVLWPGKREGVAWFHPKVARVGGAKPYILLTAQRLTGSDVFHQLHFAESFDGGKTWSDRRPVPGQERRILGGGFEDALCDVVPEYHRQTDTVLCLGTDVHYLNEKLTRPAEDRWTRYFVRRADGAWSAPKKLEFTHDAATQLVSAGCGQRVNLANGDVLVPVTMGNARFDRSVTTLLCTFDGNDLRVKRQGRVLHYAVKRGLLEPSLAVSGGLYWMTIRAEDERGYYSHSSDGLSWNDIRPYVWDDGSVLVTSTTQQHWIAHSDGLWLSYTRRDASNEKIFRWRTPTFMARFDTVRRVLIKDSERIATPMDGVAYHGNFHVSHVSRRETWITQCDLLLEPQFRGDTTISSIIWSKPNRTVA